MLTKLLNLWGSVRTSFWFIPGLMVFLSMGLSIGMVTIDRRIELDHYSFLGIIFVGGPEGARSILSTIAGSMITIAGVVFSITIVSLTLASSQFGPRLLRTFMKDTGNQVVLGTFISTFIYCLLVLRSVHTQGEIVFVPSISVTFAVILALANVVVLIYFIHHVSTSIQADRVIAAVYRDLLGHIQQLFPEELGYEFAESMNDKVNPQPDEDWYHQKHDILAIQDGYLQAIDNDGLLGIAMKNDLLIYLQYRPGEFIANDDILVTVKCSTEELDENLTEQIINSFITGQQRTPDQDAEFAIHQLVEVALRALSPGINDPFTAITCIDRLGSALCYLTNRTFPSRYRYDKEDKLRVIAKPVTFTGITNTAFDQIRQYGRSSVAVTIRLLETLKMIAAHTRNDEQQQAIFRQAQMIKRASSESLPEGNDRQDVQERYRALLDVLKENNNLTNPIS